MFYIQPGLNLEAAPISAMQMLALQVKADVIIRNGKWYDEIPDNVNGQALTPFGIIVLYANNIEADGWFEVFCHEVAHIVNYRLNSKLFGYWDELLADEVGKKIFDFYKNYVPTQVWHQEHEYLYDESRLDSTHEELCRQEYDRYRTCPQDSLQTEKRLWSYKIINGGVT